LDGRRGDAHHVDQRGVAPAQVVVALVGQDAHLPGGAPHLGGGVVDVVEPLEAVGVLLVALQRVQGLALLLGQDQDAHREPVAQGGERDGAAVGGRAGRGGAPGRRLRGRRRGSLGRRGRRRGGRRCGSLCRGGRSRGGGRGSGLRLRGGGPA